MHTRRVLFFLLLVSTAVYALAADVPILTPPPSPEPRIHGARVYGTRPSRPFLYTIPATGLRPMFLHKFEKYGIELPAHVFGKPPTGLSDIVEGKR